MNKLISWTFGSFFRTIGRIIAYIAIGLLIALLLSHSSIKKPKISNILNDIFFMQVNAATFNNEIKYQTSFYIGDVQSNDFAIDSSYLFKDVNYSSSVQTFTFTLSGNSSTIGSQYDYIVLPIIMAESTGNTNYDYSTINTKTCSYYSCQTSNNLTACTCTSYSTSSSTTSDMEYATPNTFNTSNLFATINYSGGYNSCFFDLNSLICPTNRKNINSIDIRVLNTSSTGYPSKLVIGRVSSLFNSVDITSAINNQTQSITDNQNQNNQAIINNQNQTTQEIINNQNQQTQAINNTITDESAPSNLSSISNDSLVGYLPPGPVDSLLNLPLVLLNSLQNALSSTCSPITLTLPFVNSDIVLPCMSSLYDQMGVSSFVNWAGIVASAFILFSYLLRFYKWVDNTLTFRENNWLDNWGGE